MPYRWDKSITLRISDEDLGTIDRLAEAAGVTRSEWLRTRATAEPDATLRAEIKILRARLHELVNLADVLQQDLDGIADAAGMPIRD